MDEQSKKSVRRDRRKLIQAWFDPDMDEDEDNDKLVYKTYQRLLETIKPNGKKVTPKEVISYAILCLGQQSNLPDFVASLPTRDAPSARVLNDIFRAIGELTTIINSGQLVGGSSEGRAVLAQLNQSKQEYEEMGAIETGVANNYTSLTYDDVDMDD